MIHGQERLFLLYWNRASLCTDRLILSKMQKSQAANFESQEACRLGWPVASDYPAALTPVDCKVAAEGEALPRGRILCLKAQLTEKLRETGRLSAKVSYVVLLEDWLTTPSATNYGSNK